MSDDTIKRASFGFDADFGDLSTVKPTGSASQIGAAAKPTVKTEKPKAVTKAPRKSKPKPAVRKAQDELADRLAKSQGFTSREAGQASAAPVLLKKRRRVQHAEAVDHLSIRGHTCSQRVYRLLRGP